MTQSGGEAPLRAAFQLVDDEAGLAVALATLEAELDAAASEDRPLFLDTEFESNRQGVRLCLLQIAAGTSIFLLDAQKLRSLSPLGSLLGRPSLLWVLHAGLQDVRLIEQATRCPSPQRMLDTQVAWALLGAEYSVSLAYLDYRVSGVRADKGHQADDWVRRPIPPSQLAYAAHDVACLPAIFGHIKQRLQALERLEVAISASLATLSPEPDPPRMLSAKSFRNAWQLSPAGLAALGLLVEFYNGLGEGEQSSLGEPKALMSVAARMPRNKDELLRIKGVNRSLAERHGGRLLALLQEARETKEPASPVLEPAAYGSFDEHRLDAWITTLRAEVCAEVQVAPELALPGRLTRRMMDTYGEGGLPALLGCLTGFRKSLLEAAVTRFCERQPPPV